MATTDIQIVTVTNPFDRRQRRFDATAYTGQTLRELHDRFVPSGLPVTMSINGIPVEEPLWASTVPKVGDRIVVMPVVEGGDDAKQILGAVAMIAVVWATPAIAGFLGGLTPFAGMKAFELALSGMIIVGGGTLINSVMPAPQLEPPESRYPSQVYGWGPATVQAQGIVVPRFYGKNRLYGNIINASTSYPGYSQQTQTLTAAICLCDGPIKSISNIQINDQSVDCLPDVETDIRLGTLNQTALEFDSTPLTCKIEYRPNQLVRNSEGPYEYTMPDSDYDDLEVELFFPYGVHKNHLKLGRVSRSYTYVRIEIKPVGGSYSTLAEGGISGQVLTPKWVRYLASGNYPGGSPVSIQKGTRYVIRVTKTSEDRDTTPELKAQYGDEVRVSAVRGIINTPFTHPGCAQVGISALATEQLSGSLKVSCEVEGRVLRVYDGENWTIEYSTNPAWVLYDILTHPVITGDGDEKGYAVIRYDGIPPERIDTAKFYELACFCDELVSDGEGGTEKRITFNGGFDTATSMWEAALKVCEVARCCLIWNGTQVTLAIDKEEDTPVQMFAVGNIHQNSFKEVFLPLEDRVSEIKIWYRDEKQDYKRVPFTIFNPNAGEAVKKTSIELFGTTKQTEAWRAGKYRLAQNELLRSVIEFEADIDAIACTLGDVIYVQRDSPSWGQGGRVVRATHNTITVDKSVTLTDGTGEVMVRVVTPEGAESIETHLVSNVEDNVITITDTWTHIPEPEDLWAYGAQNLYARKYRVTGLERSSDQVVRIRAIEYDPAVYSCDDEDPDVPMEGYVSPGSYGESSALVNYPRWDTMRDSFNLIGPETDDVVTSNLQWEANTPSAGYVTWSAIDGGDPVSLMYQGEVYDISSSNTNKKYIYWDVNDTPTTFHATDNLADIQGDGKWIMCTVEGGTPYPSFGQKIIHGATIEEDTVGAVSIKVGEIDALDLANAPAEANADVTADNPIETFRETFEDPNNDFAQRWTISGEGEYQITTGGVAGGKVLQAGDNSGNDGVSIIWSKDLPYDPNKLYRMRVRVKQTAGTGKFYAGIYGRDADRNPLHPPSKFAHWICAFAASPGSDWTTYTGYFTGHSTDGDATQHSDPSNPAHLREGVVYFSVRVYANHLSEPGITIVDEISIDIIPEDADQIAESDTKKWAGETGADVTADHADDVSYIGGSPPGSPKIGWIWLDTSTSPDTLKRYNGSTWDTIGTVHASWSSVVDDGNKPSDNADVTAEHALDITHVQATAPSNPQEGWLWLDTSEDPKLLKRYNGASWEDYATIHAAWSAVVDDGSKPEDNADVTADNPIETFRETFENPNNDILTRWPKLVGTGEYSVESGGVAGGKFLRIGDNAGNDDVILGYYKSIPFDPSKLYRVRVRIRRSAGTGAYYVGVSGRNATDNGYVNANGEDATFGSHWVVVREDAEAAWTVYTAYIKGTAATGDSTVHNSPDNPAVLHEDVRYFRPLVRVNYLGQPGQTDIDLVSIDIIPESADQIAESDTKKWAGESGADVTADHADDVSYIGGSPPGSPKIGWIWLDTSTSPDTLKRYNGSSWDTIGTVHASWSDVVDDGAKPSDNADVTAEHALDITHVQATAPSNPQTGWLWLDTSEDPKLLKRYNGSAWEDYATIHAAWSAVVDDGSKPEDNATDDSAWRHSSDTTKIDGGKIYTGTIVADALSVTELSAITADLGTCTSGSIELGLGGTNKLKISGSGIEGSNDSGSNWYDIVSTDSGEVVIKGGRVQALTIVTEKLEYECTTNFDSVSIDGNISVGTSWTTVATLSSFDCDGGLVPLKGQVRASNASTSTTAHLAIYRDTTQLKEISSVLGTSATWDAELEYEDDPGSGTYTYYLKMKTGAGTMTGSLRRFRAHEFKR